MKPKNSISIEEIEEMAARLPSDAAIQREAKVGATYINNRRKNDVEFKAAYERGRAKFEADKSASIGEVLSSFKPKKATNTNHLRAQICLAVQKGYDNLQNIAHYIGEENHLVYTILSDLIKENRIEKFTEGELSFYRLPAVSDDAPAAVPLTYKEIEAKILRAVDNHSCTESQIKKHAGFAADFEIDDVLESMTTPDGKLRIVTNLTQTAYVRASWNVSKFWITGSNKIGIEFAPPFEKKPETLTHPLPETGTVIESKPEKLQPAIIQEVETNPRFENTIRHITENGRSRESIEKVKQQVSETAAVVRSVESEVVEADDTAPLEYKSPTAPLAVQEKVIKMSGENRVHFAFVGNFFDLSERERELINTIARISEEFAEAKN